MARFEREARSGTQGETRRHRTVRAGRGSGDIVSTVRGESMQNGSSASLVPSLTRGMRAPPLRRHLAWLDRAARRLPVKPHRAPDQRCRRPDLRIYVGATDPGPQPAAASGLMISVLGVSRAAVLDKDLNLNRRRPCRSRIMARSPQTKDGFHSNGDPTVAADSRCSFRSQLTARGLRYGYEACHIAGARKPRARTSAPARRRLPDAEADVRCRGRWLPRRLRRGA
jgi:hypothetical protein